MFKYIFLIASLFLTLTAQAQVESSVILNEGELDIPVTRYQAAGENAPLILWLPSSHGTSPNQFPTALGLSKIGIETWVVDLHTGYFLDPGRSSVDQFKAGDIAKLISRAAKEARGKLYLMSSDSGALPTLRGIARYQQLTAQSGDEMRVAGAILFEPKLNYPTNIPGEAARYLPVTSNSTIPIYYIQPTNSTRQWRSKEIIEQLQSGGSQVFLRVMPDIISGFQQRPDEDLNDIDFAQRDKLPAELKRATQLLAMQPVPDAPAIQSPEPAPTRVKAVFGLKTLAGNPALPLNLADANGKQINIDYSQQALSLVSFWASWCQPCIIELPALKRFYDDYAAKGVKVITINVGEAAPAMQAAIQHFKMQGYTNLSDPEGETMKAWNVLGFPTNFLVSRDGALSHGSFGAVEWDAPKVRELIDQQLTSPDVKP